MKIILKEDVYNLGEEGDVCTVADGYARNFLLPKKLAVVFNNANVAYFKSREAAIAKKKEEKRKSALSLKETIEELPLKLRVSAGDSGKLFGAVTAASIAEALAKEGVHVEKKKIDVPSHSIKMVGIYTVKIRLYENEAADLKVEAADLKVEVINERTAALEDKAAAQALAAENAAKRQAETGEEQQPEPALKSAAELEAEEAVGYGNEEFGDEDEEDEEL